MQTVVTWFLTGLIWTIQIVHYPLMAHVGREGFASYEKLHSQRITWVVACPMLLEAVLALFLVVRPLPEVPRWSAWMGLGLVALLWGATAFLQVPQHRILSAGFDARAHQRLVRTNWVRTTAWSIRAGLTLWMLQAVS
jgi:hypothetical protein